MGLTPAELGLLSLRLAAGVGAPVAWMPAPVLEAAARASVATVAPARP